MLIQEDASAAARPRRPWLAFLLGFVSPGMGQLYSGRTRRAFAALLLALLVIAPAVVEGPLALSWSLPTILLGYGLGVGLVLAVPIDAALVARRSPPLATPRWRLAGAGVLFGILGLVALEAEALWLTPHLPLRMYKIPTAAMMPTLLIGDVIVADMRGADSRPVELGDVVVFDHPYTPGALLAKRVAGLPGDWVEVRSGRLLLNQRPVADPQAPGAGRGNLAEKTGRHSYDIQLSPICLEDWSPVKVPEGTLFLLGDNRCASRDSRTFGFVPMATIRGRATGVHWSWEGSSWKIRWNRIGVSLLPRDAPGADGA